MKRTRAPHDPNARRTFKNRPIGLRDNAAPTRELSETRASMKRKTQQMKPRPNLERNGRKPTVAGIFIVLLACSITAATAANSPNAGAPTDKEIVQQIERYLDPYIETNNFTGSILVARRGQVLLAKGYGEADRDAGIANGPDTIHHLASVSRTFTSAGILLLHQRGKLSLDDTLDKFIPDWPRGDEITVHHLMMLAAGFPNINGLAGYGQWSQSPQTPESLAATFRDLPLEFTPGEKTVHSNSNCVVLALLIEKISGKSFGQFLEDEFFRPLGMTRTRHDTDAAKRRDGEAIGYSPVGLGELEPAPTLDWTVKTGNGSLESTVNDLYKFDRMLAKSSLLNSESTELLFREHMPRHGYGWFVRTEPDTKQVYINGRSPGFGSYWLRDVARDITVIVLGNIYNGVPTDIGQDLYRIVRGEERQPPPMSKKPLPQNLLDELTGAYQFGPDFYVPNKRSSIIARDGHLFDDRGDWLIPTGNRSFIHRRYWSTLVFGEPEPDGSLDLNYDTFVGKKVE